MTALLKIENLDKYYGNRGNVTKALNHVSFEAERGEFLGIMGASGSGKTTLLNTVATIHRCTAGHIYLEGTDITKLKNDELAQFRMEHLGFVFQDLKITDRAMQRGSTACSGCMRQCFWQAARRTISAV